MENDEPEDTLTLEVERLSAAITEKLALFIKEDEVARSSDDSIRSIIEDHSAQRKQHFDTIASAQNFPPESSAEQVQDFITKANELAIIQLSDIMNRIECCREVSAKYSLPRLQDFKNLQSCIDDTRSVMRAWIDEAKQKRAVGKKSLLEWIRELDHRKSATTLENMRISIIDIGNMISFQLCSYFLLLDSISGEKEELAARIRAVEALLDCLNVEEKPNGNSLVIDQFKSVTRLVKRVLNVGDYGNDRTVPELKKYEGQVIASILREVLRFEVGLSCPDLPMMLPDDMLLGMAMYMRQVFERKLGHVSFELGLLKEKEEIGREDLDIKNLLNSEAKKIWDELDLNIRN